MEAFAHAVIGIFGEEQVKAVFIQLQPLFEGQIMEQACREMAKKVVDTLWQLIPVRRIVYGLGEVCLNVTKSLLSEM